VAAVFFSLLVTLPSLPVPIALDGVDADIRARTVSGAYHIHTSRSDGAGDKASVAAAAARAGLRFAIFTDHGDGTRSPDVPAYLSGVLCIDSVEISTTRGHYVALDLPAAPYPLGGESSAVAEDVKRLGGFGIAAHPDHPKSELSWTDWDTPIDGIEWLNTDVEWRNESALRLGRVLFDYFVRPASAVASVFDRPDRTLTRWDALEAARPVVGLAAADAHGGARQKTDEGRRVFGVGPSYDATFSSISNRVLLERPLTGDAVQDVRLVVDAIRGGRVYSVVDPISRDVVMNLDGSGQLTVVSPLPSGARVVHVGNPARSRLEIRATQAPGDPPVPWVVANWAGPRATARPTTATAPIAAGTPLAAAFEWRVEKDPSSSGRVSAGGGVVTLEYKLHEGPRASQFVAAAVDLNPADSFETIAFRGRADRPMRLSFQVRVLPDDSRWVRSVYLEPTEREVFIKVKDLQPAVSGSAGSASFRQARSVLFVVDLANARPGDAGTFTIHSLRGIR